jgi:hypothetical protein
VGLVSVSESTNGGEARQYYIDGVKYLNLSSAEEFEATINAFSAPLEFAPCDGSLKINHGLYVTHQPRKSFNLSYRTRVGNDTEGPDHGYKLHLVYNALAAPANRNYNTTSDSVNPMTHSWTITTLPPAITGYKRTAHLVIDSRETSAELMAEIEDILYGNESTAARMPDPDELIDIFTA